MKNDNRTPANVLDSGIAAMRNNSPTDAEMDAGAARVRHQLQLENSKVISHPATISTCKDFRSLIPAYLSSSLTPARRLLFDDHMNECVVCRKALEAAKRVPQTAVDSSNRPSKSVNRRSVARWTVAAATAAVIVLAFQTTFVRNVLWPIDVHAMVQSVEGGLYSVHGQQVRPIQAGQRVERSEVVRTGNSSGAVLELADGSRIEMNSRSELFLDRAQDGVRINLNRGNMIVTAAKQRTGHLYAATKELGVSVVGTIFEVNAGVKGSRVTVIEGEVRLQQGQETVPLRSGQQLSSDPSMRASNAYDAISWSRNLAKYAELLKLAGDVASRVTTVEMRHTSNLVPLLPETTVIFASLPNITQSIGQSYALFRQRVTENPVLSDWWLSQGASLDQHIARLTNVGSYLGSELVLAIPGRVRPEQAVFLANVTSSAALAAALRDAGFRVALTTDELQTSSVTSTATVFLGDGLMIGSTDPKQILRTLAFRAQPATNPFASTPLYRRLAQAYTEGVAWLLAVDLERMGPAQTNDIQAQQSGLGDMQMLVIEQKTVSGGPAYVATVGFRQDRRGMASWLAEPAPMGALEFVSPHAYGVAAVVTKDPSSMFDDFLGFITSANDSNALQTLRNYQTEHRVDIRRDLVAPLGNELLVAVDGPILPTPSWKIVIEINNAAQLQNAIEWSIADMNREAALRQQQPAVLSSETVGGRTYYSLSETKFPTAIHYTYWAGYMIIGPSRALLTEAIQNHDTGNSLMRAAAFRSQLPIDGRDYTSGFVYQNIQAMTASLPIDVLQQTAVNTFPSLVCIYGEPNRIVMSSKGVLGMNVASIAGITGMINVTGLRAVK